MIALWLVGCGAPSAELARLAGPAGAPETRLPTGCEDFAPEAAVQIGEVHRAAVALDDGTVVIATDRALLGLGAPLPLPGVPADLAASADALWVATTRGLVRVPRPAGPPSLVAETPPLRRVVVHDGRVWASDRSGRVRTWRDDAEASEPLTLVIGEPGADLAPWRDGIAVDSGLGPRSVRIVDGELRLGGRLLDHYRGLSDAVEARGDVLWATGFRQGLWRRRGDRVEQIPLASRVDDLVADPGGVWVRAGAGAVWWADDAPEPVERELPPALRATWRGPRPPADVEALGAGWVIVRSAALDHVAVDGTPLGTVSLPGEPAAVASDGRAVVVGTDAGVVRWAGADAPVEQVTDVQAHGVAARGDEVVVTDPDRAVRWFRRGPDGFAEVEVARPFAQLQVGQVAFAGPRTVVVAQDFPYTWTRSAAGAEPELGTLSSGLYTGRLSQDPDHLVAALPGWGVERLWPDPLALPVAGGPLDAVADGDGFLVALGDRGFARIDADGTPHACAAPGRVRRVWLRGGEVWTASDTELVRWSRRP